MMQQRLVTFLLVLNTLGLAGVVYLLTRPSPLAPEAKQLVRQTAREALREALQNGMPLAGVDSSLIRAADRKAAQRLLRRKQANADALLQGALRIASDAQAWKLKPPQFGGGGDQEGFEELTFARLSYPADGRFYRTPAGLYTMAARNGRLYVRGVRKKYGNEVVVIVSGVAPGSIEAKVGNLKSR